MRINEGNPVWYAVGYTFERMRKVPVCRLAHRVPSHFSRPHKIHPHGFAPLGAGAWVEQPGAALRGGEGGLAAGGHLADLVGGGLLTAG